MPVAVAAEALAADKIAEVDEPGTFNDIWKAEIGDAIRQCLTNAAQFEPLVK